MTIFVHTVRPNARWGVRRRMNLMTLVRRREVGRLALVRRCVLNSAPQCLSERLKTNVKIGRRVTWGHDHCKLYVPLVKTERYHKSFTFKGTQEWKSLPSEIRTLGSSTAFNSEQNFVLTCWADNDKLHIFHINFCSLYRQLCDILCFVICRKIINVQLSFVYLQDSLEDQAMWLKGHFCLKFIYLFIYLSHPCSWSVLLGSPS